MNYRPYSYNNNDRYGSGSGFFLVVLLVVFVLGGVYLLATYNANTYHDLAAAQEENDHLIQLNQQQSVDLQVIEADRDQLSIQVQELTDKIAGLEQELANVTQSLNDAMARSQVFQGQVDILTAQVDTLTKENQWLRIVRDIAVGEIERYNATYPVLEAELQAANTKLQAYEKADWAYQSLATWFKWDSSQKLTVIGMLGAVTSVFSITIYSRLHRQKAESQKSRKRPKKPSQPGVEVEKRNNSSGRRRRPAINGTVFPAGRDSPYPTRQSKQ